MTLDRRLEQLRLAEIGSRRVLDMSRVTWLDPLHLVFVAACAQRAAADNVGFEVVNLETALAGYAARMRLAALLDRYGALHDLPQVHEHDRSASLFEVHEIGTGDDVVRMATLVFDRVEPVDRAVAAALHTGIAELGANVREHSGAGSGFVAAQTIEVHGRLRFAVADAGVGMLGTLAERGALDAAMAIAMALSGTSRTGLPAHGTGLPSTVEAVSDLGGQLLLASGDAVTAATRRGRVQMALSQPFAGTLVEGVVPAARAGMHRRAPAAVSADVEGRTR